MNVALKTVQVEGLFGNLNYHINGLDEGPVMFVNAKNGMGKTTVLEMIYGLASSDKKIFERVSYDELKFTFLLSEDKKSGSTEKVLTIKKTDDGDPIWNMKEDGTFENIPTGITRSTDDITVVEYLAKKLDKVKLASCGRHWTISGNGHYDADEVIEMLGGEVDEHYQADEEVGFLQYFDVNLISANRLKIEIRKLDEDQYYGRRRESTSFEPGINVAADSLKETIEAHFIAVQGWSRTYEHDFLQRLLNTSNTDAPDIATLKVRLEYVNSLEDKVQKIGLYPDAKKIELPNRDLNDYERNILDRYLTNKETLLKPHSEFMDQVELFEQLVNTSLAYKRIELDGNQGIRVLSTSQDNRSIKLDQLSSGEQHLVILAYIIIFDTPRDCYVLIDEPELSMHLEWQSEFANNLDKIHDRRSLRFLCATHSPLIVDSRTADLKTPE